LGKANETYAIGNMLGEHIENLKATQQEHGRTDWNNKDPKNLQIINRVRCQLYEIGCIGILKYLMVILSPTPFCPSNILVLYSFGSRSTSNLTKVELDVVSNWIRFETLLNT